MKQIKFDIFSFISTTLLIILKRISLCIFACNIISISFIIIHTNVFHIHSWHIMYNEEKKYLFACDFIIFLIPFWKTTFQNLKQYTIHQIYLKEIFNKENIWSNLLALVDIHQGTNFGSCEWNMCIPNYNLQLLSKI